MKFPVFGGSDDALSNAAVRYAYIGNTDLTDWLTAESSRQTPLSEDVIITDFKVFVDTAPGAGTSRSFTIRKNGADTVATVTISDTNTSAYFAGSVNFTAGDLVALSSTPTSTPAAPGNIYWYMNMVTAGQTFLIMGGVDANSSATADNFTGMFGSSSTITSATNQDIRVPMSATMTKMIVNQTNAPGVGKSYALSVRVNNTTDALTATVSDTATAATATGSQAVVATDALVIKQHPTGTPTQGRSAWCITFVPANNGESFTAFGAGTPLSTTVTNYEQFRGVGATMPTTENLAYLKLPACTLKNLYVRIQTAPGVGTSRTVTLRDNAADSALTTTISGTNTTNADTTHTVTHTADQTIGLAFSLTGAVAASSGAHVGMVIVTTQPITTSTSSFFLMF